MKEVIVSRRWFLTVLGGGLVSGAAAFPKRLLGLEAPLIGGFAPAIAPWAADSFLFIFGQNLSGAFFQVNGNPVSVRAISDQLVSVVLPPQGMTFGVPVEARGPFGTAQAFLPIGGKIRPTDAFTYFSNLSTALELAANAEEITNPQRAAQLISRVESVMESLASGDVELSIRNFRDLEARFFDFVESAFISERLGLELGDVLRVTGGGILANQADPDDQDELFRNCNMTEDEIRTTILLIKAFVEIRISNGEDGILKALLVNLVIALDDLPTNPNFSKSLTELAMTSLKFRTFTLIFAGIAEFVADAFLDALIARLIPSLGLARAIRTLKKLLLVIKSIDKFEKFAKRLTNLIKVLDKAEKAAELVIKLKNIVGKAKAAANLAAQLEERIRVLTNLIDQISSEEPPSPADIDKARKAVEETIEQIDKLKC